MKILIAIISCFVPIMAFSYVDRSPTEVVIDVKSKPPHSEWSVPADMPDVYYDSQLGVITIVDYANVTYYVTIYDDWWNVALTDTKPGGGTIKIS